LKDPLLWRLAVTLAVLTVVLWAIGLALEIAALYR